MNPDPTPTVFDRMKYIKIQGLLLGYYYIMSIKVPFSFLYISLL